MSILTNVDSRGILRGKCSQCDCQSYKKAVESQDCHYCSHKPMMHHDMSSSGSPVIVVNKPSNRHNTNLPPAYVLDQGTDYWKFKAKEHEEKANELEKKLHQNELLMENLKKENEKLKALAELDTQHLKDKSIAQLKELEKKYKKASETISDALTIAIEAEMERAKLGGECVVCLDNKCEMLCVPCGHLGLCVSCSTKVKACPVCRGKIDQLVKVYTS